MPSVLVELGYISTPDEEQYLLSEAGSEALANSIYKAFLNYKREHDAPISRSKVQQQELPEPEEKPEEAIAETPTDEPDSASEPAVIHKPVFKIQILVSDKVLPKGSRQLKGLSPVSYYKEKGLYKYTYGETTDFDSIRKLRRQAAKDFKDAFIVAFKDGKKVKY